MTQVFKHKTVLWRQLACATALVTFGFSAPAALAAPNSGLFLATATAANVAVSSYPERIEIEDGMVTLEDLFGKELTGHLDNPQKPILRAPKPGQSRTISSHQMANIAKSNQVNWQAPAYSYRLTVKRVGMAVTQDDVMPMVEALIRERSMANKFKIRLNGMTRNLMIPTTRSIDEIQVTNFDMRGTSGSFRFELIIPEGQSDYQTIRLSGAATALIQVPILTAAILKGEVIRESDIQWREVTERQASYGIITTARELIGMAAKRTIRPNQLVRDSDIQRPRIVAKGDLIDVQLQAGLLNISMTAKALESGAMGQTIQILNTRSNKVLEAVVSGIKKVRVQPGATIKLASR